MLRVYDLIVPMALNDGTDAPADALESLRTFALDTFGGLTRDRMVRTGDWRADDGTVYTDPVATWTVFARSGDDVRTFAALVARTLDQLAVSVITPDREAWLIGPDGEQVA